MISGWFQQSTLVHVHYYCLFSPQKWSLTSICFPFYLINPLYYVAFVCLLYFLHSTTTLGFQWISDVSASNECIILSDSTSLLKKFIHFAHSYIYIFTIFFSMHPTTWTCTSSWCRCLGFFLCKEVLLLSIRQYTVDFRSHLTSSLNFTSYQDVIISTFHKHHGNQNAWQHVVVVYVWL